MAGTKDDSPVMVRTDEGYKPVTVEMVRRAVEEYDKHENDPYAYYQEEIDAVRNLRLNAREFIGFLLKQLDEGVTPQK